MQIMLTKKQSYLLQISDFFAYLLVEILSFCKYNQLTTQTVKRGGGKGKFLSLIGYFKSLILGKKENLSPVDLISIQAPGVPCY